MSIVASSTTSVEGAVNRRTVLTGAVAAAGLAALGPLVQRTAAEVHLVITDPRFARSRLFLAELGPVAQRIDAGSDLCRQWYQGIRDLAAGRTFAGLTTWIDFIVLQGCAREDGFRCRRRIEYAPASPGEACLVSSVFVPRGG